MRYYMIKEVNGERFLATTKHKNKTSADITQRGIPRLFKRKSDATNALNWWKQGEWYYVHSYTTSKEPGGWDLQVEKKRQRDRYNLEVVEVELYVIP